MPRLAVLQVCNISHWVSQINMLMHLNSLPKKPSRIVLLGGNGFIGQNLASILVESTGLLNIETGRSSSFKEVAQLLATQFQNKVDSCKILRANSITYRHYDNTNLLKAFPTFSLTKIEVGIESYQQGGNFIG